MPRAAVGGAKKNPGSHKLPEAFPDGMQLKDLRGQEWTLGKVIGNGGFGLIYLASGNRDGTHAIPGGYVIKIEPKENGPLYCEMQFYQRVLKKECIESFLVANKMKYLGVPSYIGAGSVNYNSKEYRFLVMNRFETDLQKLLTEHSGTFSSNLVFAIGLRMLDALQFCHQNEYVHADIKASNILLNKKKDTHEVYLVDFGLAYRFVVEGNHKKYKEDPRQANNGTIEFTSRDAHKGVAPSPRGDLEILGYCMLQWLCKKLPWEDQLKNPAYVAASKEKFMNDIPSVLKTCLADSHLQAAADTLKKYFELVKTMKYDEAPNYRSFKKILLDGLASAGQKDEWKIDFDTPKSRKRKSEDVEDLSVKKFKSPKRSPAAVKKSIKSLTPKAARSTGLKPVAKKSSSVKPKALSSPLVNSKPKGSPRSKCKPVSSLLVKTDSSENSSSCYSGAAHHNHVIAVSSKAPAADRKFPVSGSSSKGNGLTPLKAKRSPCATLKRKAAASIKSPATDRKFPVTASSSKSKGNGKSPLIAKRSPCATLKRKAAASIKSPATDRKFPVTASSSKSKGERKKHTPTVVRRKRVPKTELVNVSIQTSPFMTRI